MRLASLGVMFLANLAIHQSRLVLKLAYSYTLRD